MQLYTVRDDLQRDFADTLEQVAAMGYHHVEFPDLYEHEAPAVRRLCDRLNLSIVSLMAAFHVITEYPQQLIEHAAVLGNRYIVCPAMPQDHRSVEGYRRAAKLLTLAAARFAERGLALCYHHHAFEFEPLANGQTGFDVLFHDAFSSGVCVELDVYWVQYAQRDPVEMMDRLAGRIPLLHLKDMADDPQRTFAEVGTGIMDMPAIIAKAQTTGVEYLIVEQDSAWRESPLTSACISLQGARALTGVA